MRKRARCLILLPIIFLSALTVTAQDLPKADTIRVNEFYRLAEQIQDRVWPAWSSAPSPMILITPDREFLFHFSTKPADVAEFAPGIFSRPRQFPPNFQATFPAFGPPSVIVVGTPENTESATSTPWLFMLMHEHFHQLQDTLPDFYGKVDALGLSHGDTSGMWMLNYPFPYDKPAIAKSFAALRDSLAAALEESDTGRFQKLASQYLRQRKEFLALVSDEDRRYFGMQLWKEGIARYTQVKCAEMAADYQPTREFAALADYTPFAAQAGNARNATLRELRQIDFAEWKRVSFYAFGAAEGFFLDRYRPHWKQEYFAKPLTMDEFFDK